MGMVSRDPILEERLRIRIDISMYDRSDELMLIRSYSWCQRDFRGVTLAQVASTTSLMDLERLDGVSRVATSIWRRSRV